MKNPNFKRHIKTEPDAGRANLSSCTFLLHRDPSRPRNVELDEGHVDLIIKWTVYIFKSLIYFYQQSLMYLFSTISKKRQ